LFIAYQQWVKTHKVQSNSWRGQQTAGVTLRFSFFWKDNNAMEMNETITFAHPFMERQLPKRWNRSMRGGKGGGYLGSF
jgi:hypothetical protein